MQCLIKSYVQWCQQSSITKSNAKLVAFGGHRIAHLGKTTLVCEHKKKTHPIQFQVMDNVPNVLGLKANAELDIIKRIEGINSQHVDDPLNTFADVFTGLGCISNIDHNIKIKPNVQPVVQPKVNSELQRMEKSDVIEKIPKPTQ